MRDLVRNLLRPHHLSLVLQHRWTRDYLQHCFFPFEGFTSLTWKSVRNRQRVRRLLRSKNKTFGKIFCFTNRVNVSNRTITWHMCSTLQKLNTILYEMGEEFVNSLLCIIFKNKELMEWHIHSGISFVRLSSFGPRNRDTLLTESIVVTILF